MTDIYDQHDKAFAKVSAYVVLHRGDLKARVAIKCPQDGAGRLYAYVHWLGAQMTRGHASGGGYDKASAAVESALVKMPMISDRHSEDNRALQEEFIKALRDGHSGSSWQIRLERNGFQVIQAV